MAVPSIIATRQEIVALLQPVVGLDLAHVTAYPPKPINRPAVWVDAVASGDGGTGCGPEIVLTLYVVGEGDATTQRQTLDGYIEKIWKAVANSNRFVAGQYGPASVEEAVPLPAYRLTLTAPL